MLVLGRRCSCRYWAIFLAALLFCAVRPKWRPTHPYVRSVSSRRRSAVARRGYGPSSLTPPASSVVARWTALVGMQIYHTLAAQHMRRRIPPKRRKQACSSPGDVAARLAAARPTPHKPPRRSHVPHPECAPRSCPRRGRAPTAAQSALRGRGSAGRD
jgi:hypothetical protein